VTVQRSSRGGTTLRPVLAALLLGGLGLIAGIYAPLALNSDFQLGPLIGIFGTAPVGLLAGLILGLLAHLLAWKRSLFIASLGLASAALLAFILFTSLPKDLWVADLVQGRIVSCSPPTSFEAEVVRSWERSIAINPQNAVSPTWRSDLHNVLYRSRDYVADVQITAKKALYLGRKPWNRGQLSLVQAPPPSNTEKFVVPANFCQPSGSVSRHFAARWKLAGFPADTAASLLKLQTLEPVPPDIAFLAAQRLLDIGAEDQTIRRVAGRLTRGCSGRPCGRR
jgi:hypothetical protein